MARMPSSVAEFLSGKRFAVAGVSRNPQQAANAIFRKLRGSGFEVFPVNPSAREVESERCYPNLASVPSVIDGVVVVTHPRDALEVVNQCLQRDVRRVWFHRAFGAGSVSDEAVWECQALGIQCIVGGCPMMYCEPVDLPHRCMRWLLRWGVALSVNWSNSEITQKTPASKPVSVLRFSANHLLLLSRTEYRSCVVFLIRDDSTRRVYRLYDFTRALQITPDQHHCVLGKVNSAEKLYLVMESVKVETKHPPYSNCSCSC